MKTGAIAAFRQACQLNHEASIQELGNRRFDVLQDVHDATHFVFYAAYRSEADAAAHKQTALYLDWRKMVADMMATPSQGQWFEGLFPPA